MKNNYYYLPNGQKVNVASVFHGFKFTVNTEDSFGFRVSKPIATQDIGTIHYFLLVLLCGYGLSKYSKQVSNSTH